MPEAAEVTVAARQLDHVAAGRVVHRLSVTHPRTSRAQPVAALRRFVGRRIVAVDTHGKWIVVSFDGDDRRLGIHLRMSGQLLARSAGDTPADRHVHAVLDLGARSPAPRDGSAVDGVPAPPVGAVGSDDAAFELWFRDPRTFGELRVLPATMPVAPDLHDRSVSGESLAAAAVRRRVGVKAVLLDQVRSVSGIGSYLADEALHRAGISPLHPAESLTPTAWARILDESRRIAIDSAAVGGVTLPDEGWIDLWGRPGRFAPMLRVHGRPTCATCGDDTRAAVVGGRSARWCPRCQHARRRR